MGMLSVISSMSKLTLVWKYGNREGIGAVMWPSSCGVQVAGENVNLVDGVDTSKKSVEVICD